MGGEARQEFPGGLGPGQVAAEVLDVGDVALDLGSDLAGAQTAGKFLARFTTHPYIHLDIAGPAFLSRKDGYRPKGGTGVGVRLFYEFIKQRAAAR